MKIFKIFFVILVLVLFYSIVKSYADHCGQTPPAQETPAEAPSGQEATTQGQGDVGGVKTYDDGKKDLIPEFPGYGRGGSTTGEGETGSGGKVSTPPKPQPMVPKGTMDGIRAYPKAEGETGTGEASTPDGGKAVTTTETPDCGDCFIVFVETLTPNYEISQQAQGKHFPWERQFEKDAYNKAAAFCQERYKSDACSAALECNKPREVTTESLEDIYPDDGAMQTSGVKSRIGIYFRCAPKSPESSLGPFTSGMEGSIISFPLESPAGGSGGEGGSLGSGVIIIGKGSDTPTPDGTVPPSPPTVPESSQTPATPGPSTPSGTQKPSGDTPPSKGVPQTPAEISSGRPSGCNECFKVVVEKPFSQDPSDDFETQWQEEAFNKAKGICQEVCSDKGCTYSIPCGEKPVERQDIYPENLSFDPTSGRVSEGIKTRIGIYYKCIPPIGEKPEVLPQTSGIPQETPKTPGDSTTTTGDSEKPKIPPQASKTPPADSSSEPSGPTAPKVAVDETSSKEAQESIISKVPPFGLPEGSAPVHFNKDGFVVALKPDPMVPKKVMDKIRQTTRKNIVVADHIGEGTIVVQQSQEDCCNRAEEELQRCYNVERHQVYDKCMDEFMEDVSAVADHYVGVTGFSPSEVYDVVCERRALEYGVGCMEKCVSKCPVRCACSSLNQQLTIELYRALYPSGSSSAPSAPGNQGDKALGAGEMPR